MIKFPPVSSADENGLLAVSRNLDCHMLLSAYCQGVFPWPADERNILWFSPPRRAILDLAAVRISPKLRREFKNRGFSLRINTAFDEVIRNCSQRNDGDGTWLTPPMLEAYMEFHRRGFVFSFETFHEERLVGGLYGTWINSFFAGESMFYRESGASKFALAEMVGFMRDQAGLRWIDVQMLTPLLVRIGAVEIPRAEFLQKLKVALKTPVAEPVAGYQLKQKENL